MARKLSQPKQAATEVETSAAAAELQILHPDQTLPIGDRVLVLREYSFFEGLRVSGLAKPFIDDLYALFARASEMPSVDAIAEVVGDHTHVVRQLIAWSATPQIADPTAFARQADETADWIDTLKERDGELLLLAWWAVNGPFFTRRLIRRAVEAAASRSAGQGSTPR